MILLAAFAAALVFLLPSSSRAANPQLCAQVGQGDAFTISLKGADCTGADLTQIDAGTYDIVVHDYSQFHNFHLTGPGGVDMATDVAGITDPPSTGVTWTLTLVNGTYTYVCDATPAADERSIHRRDKPSAAAAAATAAAATSTTATSTATAATATAATAATSTTATTATTATPTAAATAATATATTSTAAASTTHRRRRHRHPRLRHRPRRHLHHRRHLHP